MRANSSLLRSQVLALSLLGFRLLGPTGCATCFYDIPASAPRITLLMCTTWRSPHACPALSHMYRHCVQLGPHRCPFPSAMCRRSNAGWLRRKVTLFELACSCAVALLMSRRLCRTSPPLWPRQPLPVHALQACRFARASQVPAAAPSQGKLSNALRGPIMWHRDRRSYELVLLLASTKFQPSPHSAHSHLLFRSGWSLVPRMPTG